MKASTTRRPAVWKAKDKLDHAIEDLSEALQELDDALSPVLRKADTGTVVTQDDSAVVCPLSGAIEEAANRVGHIAVGVRHLRSRLEI